MEGSALIRRSRVGRPSQDGALLWLFLKEPKPPPVLHGSRLEGQENTPRESRNTEPEAFSLWLKITEESERDEDELMRRDYKIRGNEVIGWEALIRERY